MNYENIIYTLKENIGTITLNRPDKQNAITDDLITELDDLLVKLETELDPKVIVIKGAGDSFSIGEDLSGIGTEGISPPPPGTSPSVKNLMDAEKRRARRWEYIFNYPKPTIAQVHGSCFGAGLSLAMVCDLVFAAEDAVFGDPSMRMGQLSGLPLWSWLIGTKKTKELLLFGKNINTQEAEQIGLINKAIPKGKLEEEVDRYARAISICPGDGLPLMKESINGNLEVRGVGEAWRFLGEMQLIAQQRTPGSGEFNFYQIRDQKGIEAAIEERDKRFKELGF
jgi:enoyl-CoA hydratase